MPRRRSMHTKKRRSPVSFFMTSLRGLLPEGTPVTKGMKAGDVDPRCKVEHCYTVSDKARAIGGGVLEAILHCRAFAGQSTGG